MNKPPSKPPEALSSFVAAVIIDESVPLDAAIRMEDAETPPNGVEQRLRLGESGTVLIPAPDAPAPPLEAAVNGFLDVAVIPDKTAFTSTAELVAASRQWCDEKGEWRFGARALARQLRVRGALQTKSKNGYLRGWRGVRLK